MAYDLWIERDAHAARVKLPGNIRQRIGRLIDELANDPRPDLSKLLDTSELTIPEHTELRRIRLEKWRVIYAINDDDAWVWILAIRKRPPYDYEDLDELAAKLE
jgi:mRNA interferase RelE/StbE